MQYDIQDRALTRNGQKLLNISIVTDENNARAIQPSEADALIRSIARALNAPEQEKYNGWTNRETWALKLHLDNTEGSQAWLLATARLAGENAEATEYRTLQEALVFTTEDAIKEAVETAFERALNPWNERDSRWTGEDCGADIGMDASDVYRMISDVGSLWRVNWREIAKHVIEESKEA